MRGRKYCAALNDDLVVRLSNESLSNIADYRTGTASDCYNNHVQRVERSWSVREHMKGWMHGTGSQVGSRNACGGSDPSSRFTASTKKE